MIQFPGQYHGFRVTTTGDRIISFRIDALYAESVKEVVVKEIGTEFLVNLIDVTSETNLNQEQQTDSVKKRLTGKMNALITQVAEMRGQKTDDTRLEFKLWLVEKGMIQDSTKELDVIGLAKATNELERIIRQK